MTHSKVTQVQLSIPNLQVIHSVDRFQDNLISDSSNNHSPLVKTQTKILLKKKGSK